MHEQYMHTLQPRQTRCVNESADLFGTCVGMASKGVVSKNTLLHIVSVLQECCLPCCFKQHIVF